MVGPVVAYALAPTATHVPARNPFEIREYAGDWFAFWVTVSTGFGGEQGPEPFFRA